MHTQFFWLHKYNTFLISVILLCDGNTSFLLRKKNNTLFFVILQIFNMNRKENVTPILQQIVFLLLNKMK